MKIKSRTVHFFELTLNTISLNEEIPSAVQLSLNTLIPLLIPSMYEGFEIKSGKTPIEVTQFKWNADREELALLLNKPDPDRSDVAYRKRNSKLRRLGNKATDEDIEVSAHVLIKLVSNSTTAKMLLTIGAGISPGKIVSYLNSLYLKIKDKKSIKKLRNVPVPTNILRDDGSHETYEVNHRFTFNAMPNGTLQDIVKSGKVIGLNLINTGVENFDTSTKFPVDKLVMHIDLKSESVDIPLIKKIFRIANDKRNFTADQVRVEYRDKDDSDVSPKSKTFDVARLEEAFTRSETVELESTHDDHQTKFSDEILREMRSLL
jgi:hypothetical protein